MYCELAGRTGGCIRSGEDQVAFGEITRTIPKAHLAPCSVVSGLLLSVHHRHSLRIPPSAGSVGSFPAPIVLGVDMPGRRVRCSEGDMLPTRGHRQCIP